MIECVRIKRKKEQLSSYCYNNHREKTPASRLPTLSETIQKIRTRKPTCAGETPERLFGEAWDREHALEWHPAREAAAAPMMGKR